MSPRRNSSQRPSAATSSRTSSSRGEVTPAFQVPVKSEVGGKLKELKVYAGQSVKKGDVLAIIDDTDLLTEKSGSETEIEGAQLSVDKSKGNYERAKALYEQKLISKEVYSNLESDYLISKNTFDKAERRLDARERQAQQDTPSRPGGRHAFSTSSSTRAKSSSPPQA